MEGSNMKEIKSNRILIILLGIIILSVGSAISHAQVPRTVSYQGYLTDTTTGNPVDSSPGTISITFTIYDALTGGTLQWTETQNVEVNQGVYNVVFGADSLNALNLSFDTQYWLGTEVGTDGEMIPRQALTSVPYAMNSDTVDGMDATDFASMSHNHNALDAADGSPADAVSVDNSGNVGIGTANPVQKLHIDGSDGNSFMKFTNTATGDTDADGLTVGINSTGDAFIYNRDSTLLRMGTANSTQITVRSDGNVGIGTIAPTEQLTVIGTILGSSSGTGAGVEGINTSTGIGVYGNANMYGVYGAVKDVNGYGVYGYNDGGGYAGYFEGKVKSTGDMNVDGNVGIGVPIPGQRLSVAGVIESTTGGVRFPDGTTQTTSFNNSFNSHAVNPSAHHTKTTSASELTSGLLPIDRINNGSITSAKLASNSVGTAQITDGNVTPDKVSAGFILNLLGLELVNSTQTLGNPSSFPTSAAPTVTCPAGKQAIACGFQTNQNLWHVEAARPNNDTCIYAFTTCIYQQGGGFVCPFGQEPVHLTATCVNDSTL
jgi:hypothetical protein